MIKPITYRFKMFPNLIIIITTQQYAFPTYLLPALLSVFFPYFICILSIHLFYLIWQYWVFRFPSKTKDTTHLKHFRIHNLNTLQVTWRNPVLCSLSKNNPSFMFDFSCLYASIWKIITMYIYCYVDISGWLSLFYPAGLEKVLKLGPQGKRLMQVRRIRIRFD